MNKTEIAEIVKLVVGETIKVLEEKKLIGASKPINKTAYAKTEQLLYNYRGFKKIVAERMLEIEELRKYGVPKNCAVTEYVQKGGMPQGIVLEEESVEDAVRTVQRSVEGTVQIITLIDKSMAALKTDPYYNILEMRYFDGRTQEDIAVTFGCNQATIARNKSRLIKELAMRLFPDQVASEYMS